MKTQLKVSQTSKMPCPSWSLEAVSTCPGSILSGTKGKLVEACSKCYANKGFYRMKTVKDVRINNKEDWKRSDFEADMIAYLDTQRYFRWFDSGDIYTLALAEKIYNICKKTSWVKHWIPTRSYKFKKYLPIFNKLKALCNVSVRYSSDSIKGEYTKGLHGSTIIPKDPKDFDPSPEFLREAFICGTRYRKGSCGPCRACWNKDIPLIAYVQQ